MFIKNGLRFVIHQRYNDPATGEKGIDMTRPENRERFGVTEIADPVRMPDETHYNQEVDEAPYLICTPKPAEMVAKQNQVKLNATSLQYLASTDWMVIRAAEGGTPLSLEVKALRQAARDAIVVEASPV